MMTTLVVEVVGGAVLGLLLFALGLAVGNHGANPLVDEFDVPPARPGTGPIEPVHSYPRLVVESVFCPACGCTAGGHGPDGCRTPHLDGSTCTNTAEDVVHLAATAHVGADVIELLATIEDLFDATIHETRCTLVVHDVDVDDYRCDCLLADLRATIRGTLGGAIADRAAS